MIITEQTPFCLYDLGLEAKVACDEMGLTFGVLIDPVGVNDGGIDEYSAAEAIPANMSPAF